MKLGRPLLLQEMTPSWKRVPEVLENMADAARELFGNDKNLSELIIFGYKLVDFDGKAVQKKSGKSGKKDDAVADNISRAQFAPIPKPNKKRLR